MFGCSGQLVCTFRWWTRPGRLVITKFQNFWTPHEDISTKLARLQQIRGPPILAPEEMLKDTCALIIYWFSIVAYGRGGCNSADSGVSFSHSWMPLCSFIKIARNSLSRGHNQREARINPCYLKSRAKQTKIERECFGRKGYKIRIT